MKLLFLCKRRPMSRDLLTSPYGRFYYLPRLLTERGHDVTVALLDYRGDEPVDTVKDSVRWMSLSFARYRRETLNAVRAEPPDWIVGFSDTYFGILARGFARRLGCRYAIDAYDNYESYMPWAFPLHALWRRALRDADLITAAGPGLVELMSRGQSASATAVVPMAADPTGFEPRDKAACRRELGLPADKVLVGYCGSMHRSRGVEVLFDALPLISAARPQVGFVHSGRTWKDVPLPDAINSLGYIDDDKVPVLLNSMDVLVVVNRDSAFGQHSHPVKLYEAMSCGVPVVATRTQATEWILSARPERLFDAGDPEALTRAVLDALDNPSRDSGRLAGWDAACDALEAALARNGA